MVERVKFLSVDVNYKTYNRVIRVTTRSDGGTSDLILSKELYLDRLFEKNEFIRLKCGENYADLKIKTWLMEGQTIVVSFGVLIDYSKAVIFPTKEEEAHERKEKQIRKIAEAQVKEARKKKAKVVKEVKKEPVKQEPIIKVYVQLNLFN